jgi:hypothetical protein
LQFFRLSALQNCEFQGCFSGGFTGTETGSKVSSGSDPRGLNINNRLTVLSGVQDNNVSSHHVVIMADIPDDQQTVLDGLTISGGMGAGEVYTFTTTTPLLPEATPGMGSCRG